MKSLRREFCGGCTPLALPLQLRQFLLLPEALIGQNLEYRGK